MKEIGGKGCKKMKVLWKEEDGDEMKKIGGENGCEKMKVLWKEENEDKFGGKKRCEKMKVLWKEEDEDKIGGKKGCEKMKVGEGRWRCAEMSTLKCQHWSRAKIACHSCCVNMTDNHRRTNPEPEYPLMRQTLAIPFNLYKTIKPFITKSFSLFKPMYSKTICSLNEIKISNHCRTILIIESH